MKTKLLITLIMLISTLVNGLASYHFFRLEAYNLASLLIIASFLSIVLSVDILSGEKTVLQ